METTASLWHFHRQGSIMGPMGKKTKFLILGILALMVVTPLFASAQLIPCGGKNQDPCTLCHLFDLAQKIVDTLTKIIAPAIAVLAFSIGGFKILMSGPNPGYRAEGIKAIRNGIIGLLIVFGAWIIVNELLLFVVGNTGTGIAQVTSLNPWTKISCIPAVKVTEEKPTTTTGATTGTGAAYCQSNKSSISQEKINGYVANQVANIAALGAVSETGAPPSAKIIIAGSGPFDMCNSFTAAVPSSGIANCTSVAYLPSSALTKIIKLQQILESYCLANTSNCGDGYGSKIFITGGTECGHKTHGFDNPVIDVRSTQALVNYFTSRGGAPACTKVNLDGITVLYEVAGTTCAAGATHYHLEL